MLTAEQANAGDLAGFEVEVPDPGPLTLLHAELVARLDRGEKERDALVEVAAMRAEPPAPADLPIDFVQSSPEPPPDADLFGLPDDEAEPEPDRTPEQRLEAIAERRERLARERAECDQELAALAASRAIPVAAIAERVGVSRQAIYQLSAA